MSEKKHLKVWYRLMDYTGKSYKDSTPTKAHLFEDAVVVDLKSEAKRDCFITLAGVAPCQLRVYLLNKNISIPPTELEPDAPVYGLGAEYDNPLIIVVPWH